jgi:lipid-binding SYLF domain-containing protein
MLFKQISVLIGWLLLALLLANCGSVAVTNTSSAENKIRNAITVFQELNQQIPEPVLQGAKGIMVIPDVGKLAIFGLGGEAGVGVLSKRISGRQWSNPVFINISSASVGFQIGVKTTDIVLLVMDENSLADILAGQFALGVQTGVSAGPIGADAKIDTTAKIYSYSRSSGLYAGISLEGLNLSVSNDANTAFYGNEVAAAEVLSGKVQTTSEMARNFRDELEKIK